MKARVARLEYALERTIKSFTRFQDLAIGVDNLPPRIALEISKTALDIAAVAQKAHLGEPCQKVVPDDGGSGKLPNGQDATEDAVVEHVREVWPTEAAQIFSLSNPSATSAPRNCFTSLGLAKNSSPLGFSTAISTQQNLAIRIPETGRRTSFAERLLQLCLERGVQLAASPNMTSDDLHPALSIHLTWVTVEELRFQILRAMTNGFEHPQEYQGPSNTLFYPDVYRSIEGSDGIVVPRVPELEPQQLVHGQTRTKIGTNLRDFQGEWLEPIDVQEYLELKGIFLGSSGPSREIQITIPESTLADIWTQQAGSIFTEEIQRSRIMSTSWPFGIESHDLELKVLDDAVMQPSESQVPTLARQNDSRVTGNPEQSSLAQALHEYQTQSNATQYSLSNELYQLGYAEQLMSVTLHLDRLTRLLVGAACCIGSGPGIRKEAVDHALRVSITAY